VVSFWGVEGVVVVVVVVTSRRGGGEDEEKEIQPGRAEAKKSTAISLCRIGEFTSPSEQRFSLPHPRSNRPRPDILSYPRRDALTCRHKEYAPT
jgi:hypothetical protein